MRNTQERVQENEKARNRRSKLSPSQVSQFVTPIEDFFGGDPLLIKSCCLCLRQFSKQRELLEQTTKAAPASWATNPTADQPRPTSSKFSFRNTTFATTSTTTATSVQSDDSTQVTQPANNLSQCSKVFQKLLTYWWEKEESCKIWEEPRKLLTRRLHWRDTLTLHLFGNIPLKMTTF